MELSSEAKMRQLGERLGRQLSGGEVIELVGDVGAGKTTFTKGLARGLGIDEPIQSPTFTINRIYAARDDLQLIHYDFYRLDAPGIMADELREAMSDPANIVVIEWAGLVDDVLPENRLTINIETTGEETRRCSFTVHGKISESLKAALEELTK